jgi:hypothetical protein
MRKNIFFIIIFLFIVFSYIMIKCDFGSKTIEGALSSSHPEKVDIIFQEKTDYGFIVLYHQPASENSLVAAIVKKNLWNYKMIYNTAHGDIDSSLNRYGFVYMFLPSIEKTSLPLYLGIISNPDITQIKVIEKESNIEEKAKIIESNGYRIWEVDMRNFKGTNFQIIALSKDNKELSKREDIVKQI